MSAPGSKESRQDLMVTCENWLGNVKCGFQTQQTKHMTQNNEHKIYIYKTICVSLSWKMHI